MIRQACVIGLAVAGSLWSMSIMPAQSDSINTLFRMVDTTSQITWVDIYDEGTPTYFAASFKTLDVPFDAVRGVLEDYTAYARTFRYIERSDLVQAQSGGTRATYFWSVKAAFAHAWFLADLDTAGQFGSNAFFARIVQNRDEILNGEWRKSATKHFTFEMADYLMFWLVEPLDNNRSRVAFVAKLKPAVVVPAWLYRRVGRRVFPRFILDIERALKK